MRTTLYRLVVLVILVLCAGPALAQMKMRQAVNQPVPTDKGVWDGTYFHVNRDAQMGLWVRTVDGAPVFRLQYFGVGTNEQFATEWDGHSDYTVKGAPGRFDLVVEEGDAVSARGRWSWVLEFADSGRTEEGQVKIYRTGDGRQLVFDFQEFMRTIRRGDQVNHYPAPQVLTFRKISKRELLWDELPF